MKLIELVNSVEALNEIAKAKLPAAVSFSLGKFLKEISLDIETYNKVRNEKLIEYGTPILNDKGEGVFNKNGNQQYSFSDAGSSELNENGKKYVAEMTEIENKELEFKIPEITIKDLGETSIEPKYLLALSWLILEK